jgi:RimJ/RimL family protein N-acetyltransferase
MIEIDGRVVGHIASFDLEGRRDVTYWNGREDWGRGIATRALQEFLQLEATRPNYAGAASDNAASIRVLTKCGFVIVGHLASSLRTALGGFVGGGELRGWDLDESAGAEVFE